MMPEGPFKFAAMRFNLENGKIGEFAVEGLDARSPKGPVKIGRIALCHAQIHHLCMPLFWRRASSSGVLVDNVLLCFEYALLRG